MHTSHSTGENRLIGRTLADFNQTKKTSTRGAQVSATPTQQTFTNRTPVGSANYAIPLTQPSTYGTVSKAPQIVPTGYNIKNDPTYIGNMGPSAGESWSGGTQRSDGTMAGGSNANPYMTIEQQAQAYADALVKPPEDPAISRDFNAENMAKEQAKQAYYAKLQADTVQKRADAERKYKQMLASNQQTTQEAPTQPTPIQPTPPTQVASTGNGAINAQTQPDLTMQGRSALRGEMRSKQDFIEQKRAEGMSDAQIRQALAVLPPDTFKISTQQTPPPTPSPTPQPTPTGGKGTQGAPEQQNVPPPVTIPPNAQAIRDALYKVAVASGDPMADLRKAIYDSEVLREEQAKQNALISLGASIQGAEQEYTDTQAYIEKWAGIATQNSDKLTNLLQTQNEETNKVLEQQKSNILQKLEFDKQVQTQQLEKQKAQDVLKSSIAIALRGGAYSGAAQESLASAEREWDIGIQNLAKEFSFKAADVTTDFTSKYVTAKQNLALNLYNASQELSNKIEGYANAGFASLQAKKKAITEARNSYRTTIDKIQEDHSKDMKTMTKDMGEMINKNRDDQRAQEQLGINMLDKLVDTYGNNVPPSLLETVKKYIPNIDIQDVMKRRTLAQMKKGAGGTGGYVGGIISPSNATIASLYTNITPQQLKEAVKRAFSPQNYGGTDKERLKRENEYMSRIASGESPASIIQSLGSDYWSSQKGAQRTMHTERVTSQGSAESLQEFVNYYGIKAGDDGPLGSIDSRVQGLASVFGLSSEEYNNMATNVGNIRAKIIKENYGAAVTPQELNIAKSYIPDMKDKGAQFVTKLQNLKSYQAYLDAKVLADSLGLPMPKPPSPITLSGDKISGPSKFSVDDINSTLSE